jgi:hypothetical protein
VFFAPVLPAVYLVEENFLAFDYHPSLEGAFGRLHLCSKFPLVHVRVELFLAAVLELLESCPIIVHAVSLLDLVGLTLGLSAMRHHSSCVLYLRSKMVSESSLKSRKH